MTPNSKPSTIGSLALGARLTLGTLWGLTLVIAGVLLLTPGAMPGIGASIERITIPAALWSIASGEFVFLVIVADRIFPQVPARLRVGIETFLGGASVIMLVTVVLTFLIQP